MRFEDSILAPLGSGPYRIFTIGNIASLLGSWSQRLALGWVVWELTASGTWIGALAFCELFPMIFIAPFAGVFADCWPRLPIMRASQIFFLFQALTLYSISAAGIREPGILLAVSFLGGIVLAFDHPFRLSLIPSLVEKKFLGRAVALNSIVFNSARFIGPAIAGFAIASGGSEMAFVFNVACCALFAAALFAIPPRPEAESKPVPDRILRMVWEGWSYVAAHPGIRMMILLSITIALSARSVLELLPSYASLFRNDPTVFASMTGVVGIGSIGGGLLVGRIRSAKMLALMVVGNSIILGVLVVIASLLTRIEIAIVLLAMIGFCIVISAIGNLTVIQITADTRLLGRVLSAHSMIFRGGPAVGAFMIGFLSDLVGLRLPLAAAGVFATAAGLYFLLNRERALRTLD